MEKSQLAFLSATELGSLIKSQEVSPVEATEAYLERIPQIDGKLNSYITVTADRALADAKKAEQEIVSGKYRGPMHGVPIAVKDQLYTKGILTTGGSTILKDFVPDEDATVISNLNDAGAVLLGKLNMSEFAMGDAFEHPYGRPRNPWDLSRNAGTSSSGSGAATAAFLCATSLGEDTGGSIRGPASFCGLVGIRPSWGRVSRHGVLGASWSMDQVGPISRTVSDCA
ncbi:MAG: amidase, partial [SAR202 cluster bacterium]|nr:amidase [SAR202 cluster bacterium]